MGSRDSRDRDARDSRGARARVVAVVALWAAVMGGVGLVGCYGHNCDGDFLVYGRGANEGRLLDADTWESSPIDGKWLPFPKQRIWAFEMKDLGDRTPYEIIPYVSAQNDPTHDEGGNFTVAAGNLTEIFAIEKGKFAIKNDTCADYSVRVVVKAAARPPATPATPAPARTTDAGGDAEAGP